MSQESLIFLLGVAVMTTPLLGVPNAWKQWVFVGLGVVIVIIGYRLRRAAYIRSIETEKGERRGDAFVENHAPLAADFENAEPT